MTDHLDNRTNAASPSPANRNASGYEFIKFDDARLPTNSHTFVQGLLSFGGFSVLYGEPGCGKSFFASDLALHVALGWTWNGLRTKAGTVLYIAAEGGFGFQKRLEALKRAHNVQSADFYLLPRRLNLLDPDSDVRPFVSIAGPFNPQLIIIDTLNRTFGGGDENSSKDMSQYVAHIDHIAAETGAHCMVVHHSGKDQTRGSRGHSALPGALDTILEIKNHGTLKSATVIKSKDGEDGAVFTFALKQISLGVDEFDDPITSCVVDYVDQPSRAGAARPHGQGSVLLRLIENVIASDGLRPPSSNHIPASAKAVQLSLIKKHAQKAALSSSDNPNSQNKAFTRAFNTLKLSGHIAVWDGWVWLVKA